MIRIVIMVKAALLPLRSDLSWKQALTLSPPTQVSIFDYAPIHVRSSTFIAGLSQRIHRWFRLTPSFGPDLVQAAIDVMGVKRGAHIHDPFSGAGTTAIEASLEGYNNSCIEINPLLHFVNKVCLDWTISSDNARSLLAALMKQAEQFRRETTLTSLHKIGINLPPIHNIHRWWREDVLHQTLCIKAAINEINDTRYRDFFRLSLAGVLVPDLSNVTLGRLQLHFIDRSKHNIDAFALFKKHSEMMLEDLSILNERGIVCRNTIIHGDSTDPASYASIKQVDAVVTSPPYPNRYSYVWNTRPHLYMLDFITAAKAASDIDRKTIGGTWGTATSELLKGEFLPVNDVVDSALAELPSRIRAKDNLMANYIVHYFNRIARHLASMSGALNRSAHLAYVVGNSSIKDEYVATDAILASIIEGIIPGMRVKKIHRFRKRHSGVNLYESIVYASR